MMAPKPVKTGRCPHCQQVRRLLNRNTPNPYMRAHIYRPPKGRKEICPGTGKPPVKGTAC